MLYWSIMFFAMTVIAAIAGFSGGSTAVTVVAQILFVFFLLLCIFSILCTTTAILPSPDIRGRRDAAHFAPHTNTTEFKERGTL